MEQDMCDTLCWESQVQDTNILEQEHTQIFHDCDRFFRDASP